MTSYQKIKKKLEERDKEIQELKNFIMKKGKVFFAESAFLGTGRLMFGYVQEDGRTRIIEYKEIGFPCNPKIVRDEILEDIKQAR